MNTYLQFQVGGNWKRFVALFKDFNPVDTQPAVVRTTLLGAADVTFAPATLNEWRGTIKVPVTAQDGNWGDVATFKAIIALRTSLPFIDHYGTQYTVAVVAQEYNWKSFNPMWDAASNHFLIPVRIVRTA